MSEIVWEEPPAIDRGRSSTVWRDRLSPVMQRPGEWARVFQAATQQYACNSALNLRKRKFRYPEGKWEFRAHANYVYARYIGPD